MDQTSRTSFDAVPTLLTNSARRQARQNPGRAADQVRSRHQSDHGQGARADDPGVVPAPRRRGDGVTRRVFIALLGGVASWPLTARAQQPDRMRRIGVLMSMVESDPRGLEFITAFAQGLAELGWTVGRNVRIEYRWGAGDLDRFRRYAAELVALSPDVVLATAGSIVGAFQQASRTVPIVFV